MSFIDSFNAALPDMEGNFGETFQIAGGATFTALSIETLEIQQTATGGGLFRNATVTLEVTQATATAAGLRKGLVLTVRGEQVRILGVKSDIDASVTYVCGPAGIDTPRA